MRSIEGGILQLIIHLPICLPQWGERVCERGKK